MSMRSKALPLKRLPLVVSTRSRVLHIDSDIRLGRVPSDHSMLQGNRTYGHNPPLTLTGGSSHDTKKRNANGHQIRRRKNKMKDAFAAVRYKNVNRTAPEKDDYYHDGRDWRCLEHPHAVVPPVDQV